MNEKEIELKVEGQILTVRGERNSEESKGYAYHQQESYYGPFSRSFTLPDSTNLEGIKADYKNGILDITVPQQSEVKTRSVKINI